MRGPETVLTELCQLWMHVSGKPDTVINGGSQGLQEEDPAQERLERSTVSPGVPILQSQWREGVGAAGGVSG